MTIIEEQTKKGYFIITALVAFAILLGGLVFSINTHSAEVNFVLENQVVRAIDVEKDVPEPKIEQPVKKQSARSQTSNNVAVRTDNVQNILEVPKGVPPINSVPNVPQRPLEGGYRIGKQNLDAGSKEGGRGTGTTEGQGLVTTPTPQLEKEVEPEIVVVKKTPTPEPTVNPVKKSLGVINSKAINLVKPAYPTAARAARAEGTVSVSVRIDKFGRVTVLGATGNPLLLQVSREAASKSTFSPTLLSNEAVDVTGIIVYNFKL